MDRLDALRAFASVVELGGFSRAAESLGLPKASVSTAVRQLEASLGTRLLHRTTRRVELSQDGRVFYERCRDLLADADDLNTLFHQEADLAGRLRVDLPSGIAQDIVLPALGAFLDRHPRLEIELGSSDRRVDLVREGFDCVLRIGRLDDSSLVVRRLGEFAVANWASRAYLQRHGEPTSPEALDGHRLIHFAGSFGGRPDGFEYFDGERYVERPMAGALTVNSAAAYEAACLAGLGIIQAPRVGRFERLPLVEILRDWPAEPMPVSLLYPHRRSLPRRVAAFMTWLEQLLQPWLHHDAARPSATAAPAPSPG
jgi:DNA-binding transcriptional LysR family regulator